MLTRVFGLHPLAVHDCEVRNRMPKLHAYPDALFVVLHAPERGERRARPLRRARPVRSARATSSRCTDRPTRPCPLDVALRDTTRGPGPDPCRTAAAPDVVRHLARDRLDARRGGWRSSSRTLTEDVWDLEQRVTAGQLRRSRDVPRRDVPDPPRTAGRPHDRRADREIYRRVAGLSRAVPGARAAPSSADLVDQFDRVSGLAERGEGLPAGRHRVLPRPHRHEDDHRRRTTRRDRRGHPADHRPGLGPRDEPHRQRAHDGRSRSSAPSPS